MAARYAANTAISRPIAIAATPDVDFNGFMFSYVVGLMFPPQAAQQMARAMMAPPPAPPVGRALGAR